MPRTSIKGQVLTDLVAGFAECPEEMEGENQKLDEKSIGVISIQCPILGNCTLTEQRTKRIRSGASPSVT